MPSVKEIAAPVEPAKPTDKAVKPTEKVTKAKKMPEVDPDKEVLFLYEPQSIGASKRGQFSETALMVPIPAGEAEFNGTVLPRFDQKTVAPGLQRILKTEADAILAVDSDTVQEMVARNVIRIWADTTELDEMPESLAIDSIRKASSVVLLTHWASRYGEYSTPIQNELKAREQEIAAMSTAGTVQTVFGQPVN